MPLVEIKIVDAAFIEEFGLPEYATDGSAGLDLRACIDKSLTIAANDCTLIQTGLMMHLAQKNLAALILPRSGLGHKQGIVLGNLTGLIDSDYQGEILISCWNRSAQAFTVNRGDRIAQLVIVPIVQVNFSVVDAFQETIRGNAGFGSTGQQ